MGLFNLPRELRDLIYEFYVTQRDPLRYFPDDAKLRTQNGDSIDLNLTYVCKQASVELSGMMFRHNTIEFVASLNDNPATVSRASRFHAMVHDVHQRRLELLNHCRPYITAEIIEDATIAFPYCTSLLPVLTSRRRSYTEAPGKAKDWGTVPSEHRDLITYLIQQIQKQPDFMGFRRVLGDFIKGPRFLKHAKHMNTLAHPICESWKTPSDAELDRIEETIPGLRGVDFDGSTRYRRCFSAAALAADFLASLPRSLQIAVREIRLHETHIGAGYTECHARALIPYCIENPNMRVKRHVDLWQNVLPGFYSNGRDIARELSLYSVRGPRMPRPLITETVAIWIDEALALPAAGMPPGAFSLIFDGTFDYVQYVINVMKYDAVWQESLESCLQHQSIAPPTLGPDNCAAGHRGSPLHFSKDFPRKLATILAGDSFISFSGVASSEPISRGTLVDENRTCTTHDAWIQKWKLLSLTSLEPVEPWPSWQHIQRQYTMPPLV